MTDITPRGPLHEFELSEDEIRTLDITDEERIKRFRRAGYGGNVSDALDHVGVRDTVLSTEFVPLVPGMQLVGRALPVKLHSQVKTEEEKNRLEAKWEEEGSHPQRRMMDTIGEMDPGSILCFDCGGDVQPAHFGEMSCRLAYSQGCRGMLVAGNMRDTQYVVEMEDFPSFTFGTVPNAFGGWAISDVNRPVNVPGHLSHYVPVTPGDFIFGDRDGVQVIPEKVVDEVLLRVEEIFEEEEDEREQIAEGMPVDEVYDEYGVL